MVLEILVNWVIGVISALGYPGILVLSAIESANIPIPSEVIVPFSGYLAWAGRFSFWAVVAAAGLGNLLGSLLSYWIGLRGGRAFVQRYCRYLFVHISRAERWFERWGDIAVFIGRLLPGVRTFISLPAGMGRMDLKKFAIYTLAGSLIWSAMLAAFGLWLGPNWETLIGIFREFEVLIVLAGIALLVIWKMRKRIFS